MVKLYSIPTGFFKLDGGAMFGVVPKVIWNKLNPADEKNLCTWAMRCLLVQKNDRLILIDSGIGNKQSEKFFSYYDLHGEDSLEKSLEKYGFHPDDVTDVFFTHLHFDHCGGAIKWNQDKTGFELTFKNANYWTHSKHWDWATHPNAREKASFLKENIFPMQELGALKFVDLDGFDLFSYYIVSGHTESQMIPVIHTGKHTVCFVADLLPSIAHIPIPYVMAYDTRPLLTLKEKEAFLTHALENRYILFFEHDPVNECCTLKMTEKGIREDHIFMLNEMI
jgi:glyoxylase-like metal-dependent hydrolase (beta-lactamase superfamily II)